MFSKFISGIALLLGVATVFAGQANSLFSVQVTLIPAGGGTAIASTGSCVSSSSSGSASASVQVLCSTAIFVDISRSVVRVPHLITGFSTSADSPLSYNDVTMDGPFMEARTGLRVREDRGILTALRVPTATTTSGPLEMLVSF